ncbi:pentatricopeptide repeat-containing protein At5g12100, mitochondrial-like [Papaver somniferum]|uniref:pentatricopeptide repeat-containing protein At5g12100, mitochondrial-like n=1 Tax=Papaver somniferum TaxID=3469 RepID=UPI000E6F650D|nr:pentatricopeptide repeat-containing protein At5g12100, mitochondrial-like [Papaver somniferum]
MAKKVFRLPRMHSTNALQKRSNHYPVPLPLCGIFLSYSLSSSGNQKQNKQLHDEQLRSLGASLQSLVSNKFFSKTLDSGIVTPDRYAYNKAVHQLEKIIEDAGNMFVKMLNKIIKPNKITYNTLIDGYCKAGDLNKAFEIREQMVCSGFVPDLLAFNTFLSGLCRVNQLKEVRELLNEMKMYGFVPDGFTSSSLIEAFSKLGDSDGLLAVFEAMLRGGVQLNAYTCCPLLKGICKEGK